MTILLHLNLAVRFGLELVLLGAVALTAWQLTGPGPTGWLASTVAAALVAVGWVAVVHGQPVPAPARALGQVVALALGVACLLRLGAPRAAVVVAGTALVNAALLTAWDQ